MLTRRSSRTPMANYTPPPEVGGEGGSTSEKEAPFAKSSGKRKAKGSAQKKHMGARKKRNGEGASSGDDGEFSVGAEPSFQSDEVPVTRSKKVPFAQSSSPPLAATGATPTLDRTAFPIGSTGDTYRVLVSDRPDDGRVTAWFAGLRAALPPAGTSDGARRLRGAVGLDCEWCPPWFRDDRPERIDTVQLYSPLHGGTCLVLSVGKWDFLPAPFLALLADGSIAKVGVNVTGDGSRLARDFDCPVHGLLNLEQQQKDASSRVTLETLCRSICPASFRIDKDAVEAKVRLGNWAAWPLTEPQLRYASMDALISFAIFLYQNGGAWATRCDLFSTPDAFKDVTLQSCQPLPPDEKKKLQSAPATEGRNSNFFLMHRNRSIVPPNLHRKQHPQGAAGALEGAVVVISGVLDSMSREDMTRYVLAHGGAVKKAITRTTTHLVNDHGSIGPSKLKKCKAQGIPVVSEDVIFGLVAKSIQ